MLVDALRAMGLSNRDAGREVLAGWKKRERLDEYPQSTAIAVKVGLLAKGDATWWLNHEPALTALAELLRCKPNDLLPQGTERRPTRVEFPEFDELAGLLPGQEPCAVNPDGWLGAYVEGAFQQGGRWWFVVPPGAGKSLAVRVLSQRYGTKWVVTTARTLFEAAREAKQGIPLVVEIDCVDGPGDTAAIAEISRRAEPTCILAPFERPGHDAGWNAHTFALHHNWREQLVGWLRSRVPTPGRIDVEAVLDWLDAADPLASVFSTPGDVISVVARFYRGGIPDRLAGLGDLSREWLSQTLARDGDTWLRRLGREAMEHAVGERVRRLDLDLEPLSISRWAELLPASVLRSRREPSVAKRGKKAQLDLGQESTNAREAIHMLADRGVLRATIGGGLDVFPNWVRAGLERDAIQHEVRSGDVSAWGLWANDASRKDAVDDALDALGPNEMVRAASRIRDEQELASIAASEALVSAFGRRFAVSAWRPTGEAIATLQALGLRQLRLLNGSAQRGAPLPDVPLTRHRPGFNLRQEADWRRESWTFSFSVPRPDTVEPGADWRLPGWASDLRLGDAPHLSFILGYSQNQAPDDDPWVLSVLRVGRSAVRACRDVELPDDVDLCLLVWVVVDGPARGWRIGKALARSLTGTRVLDHVPELLRREPDDVCVAAVAEVWRAVLQLDDPNPLHMLRRLSDGHRAFYDLLTTHLPLDAFESAFVGVDLRHLPDLFTRLLLELPDRLSRVVVRLIADQVRTTRDPMWNLDEGIVAALGHDQIDVLVDLTAERFSVGRAAAKRAWVLDPRRSLDEALKALAAGAESAAKWFDAAPPEELPQLLDAVHALASRPPWVQRWLGTVLSLAREQAPRVFEMMMTTTDANS